MQGAIHAIGGENLYAVFGSEPLIKRLFNVANMERDDVDLCGSFFCVDIQLVEIVLPGIKEVPHFVVRHGQCLVPVRAAGIGGERELVTNIAVAAVDIHERAGNGGVVIDQFGQFLKLHGGGTDFLVLDDILDFRKQT